MRPASIVGRLDMLVRLSHIALDDLDRIAVKTEEPKQQTRESGSQGAEGVRQEWGVGSEAGVTW